MAKYTNEMVDTLKDFGNSYNGKEIAYTDIEDVTTEFNEKFEVNYSVRSLSSKLRHMEFVVGKKNSGTVAKKYTDAEEATIREVASKEGVFLEDVADAVGRDTKSIGGKLISMGIYGIKKRDKKVDETVKLFTPEDELLILKMVDAGECFIEDLAEALGKGVKQVRGKLAGLRIKGVLTRDKKASTKVKIYTDEVVEAIKAELATGKTIEAIAEERNLNVRGMITTLTRLGVLEKKGKKVFWTEDRVAELKSLVDAGKTREEVAEVMKTTIMVVAKRAKADSLEFFKAEKAA